MEQTELVSDEELDKYSICVLGDKNLGEKLVDAPEGYTHAWYSYKMSKMAGVVFYKNQDGYELQITTVHEKWIENGGTNWDDMKYLGLVDKSTCRTTRTRMR
jgi:hypothetical protein